MAGNSNINVGFGSSGQVLTSNGAPNLPTFQAASGGGSLVLIQTKTASSVTSLAFTSGISTAYDDYLLIYSQGTMEIGAPFQYNLVLQISTNGGSSYITTGYINIAGSPYGAAPSGFRLMLTATSGSSITNFSGFAYLLNFTAASNLPEATGIAPGTTSNSAANLYALAISGVYPPGSVSMNAFQIVMDDGSNFSGIFSLYGIVS